MSRKRSFLTVTDQVLARIMARVDKNGPVPPEPFRSLEGGCWLWRGGLIPAGYGSVSIDDTTHMVHRVVYVALVGPIPEDYDVDHVCRVHRSCNPGHLEAVTREENILRTQRPVCRKGHLLDEDNTGPVKGHPTQRVCRKCSAEKTRRWRERRAHAA